MTTAELYDVTKSFPNFGEEPHEWDTGDPDGQYHIIGDLYYWMDERRGEFYEYAISKAQEALIRRLRHKLQIYVEWYGNCKDNRRTGKYCHLYSGLNGVCHEWLSIIDAAFPQIQPQKAGSEDGATLPDELNTDTARKWLQVAIDGDLLNVDYSTTDKTKTMPQKAQLAETLSDKIGLKNKYKPFEKLWNVSGLAQARYKSKELAGKVMGGDVIKKVFKER